MGFKPSNGSCGESRPNVPAYLRVCISCCDPRHRRLARSVSTKRATGIDIDRELNRVLSKPTQSDQCKSMRNAPNRSRIDNCITPRPRSPSKSLGIDICIYIYMPRGEGDRFPFPSLEGSMAALIGSRKEQKGAWGSRREGAEGEAEGERDGTHP